MSFLVRGLILLGVVANLASCTIVKTFEDKLKTHEPEAQLPYRHNAFDFMVAWDTSQTGNDMIVVGLIKNVQKVQVREIELNVFVVDSHGRCLSEVSKVPEVEVLPGQVFLQKNDSVHFSVKLKDAANAKENILKFIISYRTNNGSWYGRAGQSIFYVDMATGDIIEELRLKKAEGQV